MNPTLLLDTCAAIWIMNNEWMRDAAVAAMDEASDRGDLVFVSPITGWEVGILASRGRFKSHLTPQRWLRQLLATPNIRLAEMPRRCFSNRRISQARHRAIPPIESSQRRRANMGSRS